MLENMVNNLVKKYLITSAQYNADLNKELYSSMKKYCVENDSQLIVVPMTGKNITEEPILHPTLQEDPDIIITDSYKFNNNLRLRDFGVRPQQINPLTGLERFAQGDTSYILPSTKQVQKYIANSLNELPKTLITTGSITHPYYNERHRVGRIAKWDHEYGGVVAEVENNKIFHLRHLSAMKNGKYTDLGFNYENNRKPRFSRAEALIIGDSHPTILCKKHYKATKEQISVLKPKRIFLHDVFDGMSISHHYKGKNGDYYRAWEKQGLNLEKELKLTLDTIKQYAEGYKGEIYIVASNHDEHLNRYLDEGRFIRDKGNDLIASQIYSGYLQGLNPLEYGLSLVGELPSNITFLDRNDDLKIRGYQLSRHGDRGSSGGRGSQRSNEAAHGKSIVGHSHTPSKIRKTYTVGTSTILNPDYVKGYYSSWVNTNAVLYSNGTVQLLNTLKGNWRL